MPKNKDLKRLVRRRMDKTGESYTTARANLIRNKELPIPDDYEKLAGMSDDAVQKKTQKTWPEWTRLLDEAEAHEMEHRDIAQHLHDNYEIDGWWSQMITVGYERFRGLREPGQRRGGGFDVNKSKTVPVPVAELYRAFADDVWRGAWLPGVDFEIRTASTDKSLRVRWADDTAVDIYFSSKGDAKSSVTVQHRKLPDKAAAEESRAYWTESLGVMAALLTAEG